MVPASRQTSGPHVLVVEADAMALQRSSVLLAKRGFTVTAIASDDLAFGSACNTLPAAVVMSLNTRDGDRLPFLTQLAGDRRTRRIPVVISTCDDDELRGRVRESGIDVHFISLSSTDDLVIELLRIIRHSTQTWTSADFPAVCPKCGAQSGMPRLVATVPSGGVEITAACSACSHEWDIHRESDRLPNQES
jgi:CheY-like chemotaxis protein